jgi:hypothetical protein
VKASHEWGMATFFKSGEYFHEAVMRVFEFSSGSFVAGAGPPTKMIHVPVGDGR